MNRYRLIALASLGWTVALILFVFPRMERVREQAIETSPLPSLERLSTVPRVSRGPWLASDTVSIARAYARELSDFHEPDLAGITNGQETYRVLWLRSFHEPVAVRITKSGDHYWVITHQGARSDSTALDVRAWNLLHMRNGMRDFWTTTVPKADGIGLDGARWILEGRIGDQYHAVDWWSPQESSDNAEGAYRRLVLEILSMGSVRVAPDAVY